MLDRPPSPGSGISTASPPGEAALTGLAPLTGYRTDIQVLRGIAVLLVVLYHAQIVTPGGFVGVDVFFVISGYVIGRRLVARLGGGGGGVMGEFYLHRARRILPALALLLVVVILTAPLLAPIGGLPETSPTGIAASLFSANFYLYKNAMGGYFQAAAELNPLLHTWSLSVEEQFYFVIPALLLATWLAGRRIGSVRSARVLVAVLAASSFLLCVGMSRAEGTVWRVNGLRFAFFSPFTRAWEFAVGLGLVLLPATFVARGWIRHALLVAGVAAIAVAAVAFSDSMVFPGYAALLPVAGAALVIHAGTARPTPAPHGPTTPTERPTVFAPIVFLGDVSYSWYLWHWPLIVFAGAFWPAAGVLPLVVAAAVSLLPAWWSYRWVERRLRATSTSRAAPTTVLAVACILAPIAAAVIAAPLRTALDNEARAQFRAVGDVAPTQPGEGPCNDPAPYGGRTGDECTWGSDDAPHTVVLVGDSNAAHISNATVGAAAANDARLEIATLGGCPFIDVGFVFPEGANQETTPRACRRFVDGSIDALTADPPDVVVLANATDMWVWRDAIQLVDPTTGEVVTNHAEKAALLEDSLARLMSRVATAGSRVVLVDIVPKPYAYDLRSCSNLAIFVDPGRCLPEAFPVTTHDALRLANALQARAAARVGADTWSFADGVCPDGICRPVSDDRLVWRDPLHISGATSDALIPSAAAQLRETLAAGAAMP